MAGISGGRGEGMGWWDGRAPWVWDVGKVSGGMMIVMTLLIKDV